MNIFLLSSKKANINEHTKEVLGITVVFLADASRHGVKRCLFYYFQGIKAKLPDERSFYVHLSND